MMFTLTNWLLAWAALIFTAAIGDRIYTANLRQKLTRRFGLRFAKEVYHIPPIKWLCGFVFMALVGAIAFAGAATLF